MSLGLRFCVSRKDGTRGGGWVVQTAWPCLGSAVKRPWLALGGHFHRFGIIDKPSCLVGPPISSIHGPESHICLGSLKLPVGAVLCPARAIETEKHLEKEYVTADQTTEGSVDRPDGFRSGWKKTVLSQPLFIERFFSWV